MSRERSPRADAYHVAELFFHFIKVNLLQICCAVAVTGRKCLAVGVMGGINSVGWWLMKGVWEQRQIKSKYLKIISCVMNNSL